MPKAWDIFEVRDVDRFYIDRSMPTVITNALKVNMFAFRNMKIIELF